MARRAGAVVESSTPDRPHVVGRYTLIDHARGLTTIHGRSGTTPRNVTAPAAVTSVRSPRT